MLACSTGISRFAGIRWWPLAVARVAVEELLCQLVQVAVTKLLYKHVPIRQRPKELAARAVPVPLRLDVEDVFSPSKSPGRHAVVASQRCHFAGRQGTIAE